MNRLKFYFSGDLVWNDLEQDRTSDALRAFEQDIASNIGRVSFKRGDVGRGADLPVLIATLISQNPVVSAAACAVTLLGGLRATLEDLNWAVDSFRKCCATLTKYQSLQIIIPREFAELIAIDYLVNKNYEKVTVLDGFDFVSFIGVLEQHSERREEVETDYSIQGDRTHFFLIEGTLNGEARKLLLSVSCHGNILGETEFS